MIAQRKNIPRKNIPMVHVVDLITTDEDKKYALAGRMATSIIEITRKQDECLHHDLHQCGFTHDEVKKYGHMAYSLANVEMNLMNENPTPLKSIIRRK